VPLRIKLIANPAAGRCAPQRIEQARYLLEGAGAKVELALTAARGDARAAAAQARVGGYDRIVAAGGDGTLNEVLNGLAPSAIPLAFIPLGTVNVLALEARIPFDLVAACQVAIAGRPQPVALGRAGDERFLLMAGVGFDAEVVRTVSSALKRRIGRCAYLVSALRLFLAGYAPQLKVTVDDQPTCTAQALIVGNGRLYGGRFSLTPGADLSVPEFEVLIIERCGRLALLRTALRMLCRQTVAAADGRLLMGKEIRVAGVAPLQFDGDWIGATPATFIIEPAALVLMTPQPSLEQS
jgi:YegS/Rv2252/BmrU family lipid kinase